MHLFCGSRSKTKLKATCESHSQNIKIEDYEKLIRRT